jgi:uncharacterized protein (TIGR02246 family)
MKLLAITMAAICLLFAGCGPSAPDPLSEKDIAAIESIGTAFEAAMRAGDWNAASMTYTEDAILFPPNSDAVTGRAAIREYFSTFPPITRFELTTVDIQGSGDLAVVHGTYAMTLQPPGMPPIEDHGKWLEMRKRQADGSWPYQWDMFNSSVPLPQVTP